MVLHFNTVNLNYFTSCDFCVKKITHINLNNYAMRWLIDNKVHFRYNTKQKLKYATQKMPHQKLNLNKFFNNYFLN